MDAMLKVGTRVYNHGDICNQSHFGEIVEIKISKWGIDYTIKPDVGGERTANYVIPASCFDEKFSGNGSTRFVTQTEYFRWKGEQLAKYRERMAT